MEKIINRLINDAVKGVDTYKNSGSTWLIFTENKQWVIELTKEGVLWYNYNFFNNLFKYVSMDVVDGQHYITKWVENNVIKKVKRTRDANNFAMSVIEDTIENGVRHTQMLQNLHHHHVENTIQNGVKHTEYGDWEDGDERFDDIIQNGIKETLDDLHHRINEGIKETIGEDYHHRNRIDGVIKNGIKQTKSINYSDNGEFIVDGVIKKGKII